MSLVKNLSALVLLASVASTTSPISAAPAAKSPSGFSVAHLDRSADPCQNFYQFSCGTWVKNNPIPSDQATWSPFDELYLSNLSILRGILDKASAANAGRTPLERQIGDYYAACMDESAIEKRGTAPLKAELDRIAAVQDKAGLAKLAADLHGIGVPGLFSFGSTPDYKNSTRVIAEVHQGGLGLPSRDYYLAEDPQSVETRGKYLAHLQKLFELAGSAPEKAAADAKTVMQVETALAKSSLPPVDLRDPAKTYHLMKVADLSSLAPSFRWSDYLEATGTSSIQELNIAVPGYLEGLEAQLKAIPLADWKTYLSARLIETGSPMLPSGFVQENFDFIGKTLSGVQQLPPRWKRCIQSADNHLGEALGQKYVEIAFGEASRKRMDELVAALIKALDQDIKNLDWMSAETKQQALLKLSKMKNKIGFPKNWRDYSDLKVDRADALGNWRRGYGFEFRRQLAKIGKPLDKEEWLITPSTVNAYYNTSVNDINFPAGILQPPFFDVKLDDAVNFGAIGGVIGHELTHGFDDSGRQFDADGNLRDWWTAQDGKEFEKRSSCIADQYSGYTAVDDVKVNGKLTLGENVADLGGMRIAHMALQTKLAGKEVPKIDGFTAEQRFFMGWAQIWCENTTPETARLLALTNPHAPGEYRVNGVMVNMPEFRDAFSCKAGQPMVNANVCKVW